LSIVELQARRQSGLAEKADRGRCRQARYLEARAIASASPRLALDPHCAPTARLRPTSRGLPPSLILTVKQTRYRLDTHRSSPSALTDRRAGLGVKGNAFGFRLELILIAVYHFSLLEAHQFARTLYTAATLRANCTASWQSKRRRQAETTHISHTTSCTFHIPHLPEAIGLYPVLH
jgi:hypothetical protein